MALGCAVSLAIWIRGRGPAGGLAALFALGALRSAAMLLADGAWPLPADAGVLGEIALGAAALAGLVALRSLWRTTRELDRAEDLHWDSMEAVRLLSELSVHPGASFDEKLARVLELGMERFELDHAVACRPGAEPPEILGWRAPQGALAGPELAAALASRLRLAAESPRVFATQANADAAHPRLDALLAAPVRLPSGAPFVLAFAGARGSGERFSATDKDLIGLMAQWLRSELLLTAPEAPAPQSELLLAAPEAPAPRSGVVRAAAERAADRFDLNAALRRAESRLRAEIAAPATFELELAPALPPLRPTPVAPETLALSLVAAARGLSRNGALRLETSGTGAAGAAADVEPFVTLSVRVGDASIRQDALAQVFAGPDATDGDEGGALPLAKLEALLRRSGADLSVQVESGRGATLTAFLPARRSAPRSAARGRGAAPAASSAADAAAPAASSAG
jgi:hypothetical protein